jgi:hypothetical protein
MAFPGFGQEQQQPTKDQKEIWSVLKAKHEALKKWTKMFERNGKTVGRTNYRGYLAALKAIDVAGCPEDFRIDWKEYTDACYHAETAFGAALIELWGITQGRLPKDPPADSPATVWKKLCHRAGVYRVKVPPDPY